MTTTLGLSFSARSVAKRFILFAINITILVRTEWIFAPLLSLHCTSQFTLLGMHMILIWWHVVHSSVSIWANQFMFLWICKLLGVACSVLCLYQVKLMPAYYDEILANLKESNLTDLASARIKIMPAHQAFTQRLPVAAESDSQLLTRNKQKV